MVNCDGPRAGPVRKQECTLIWDDHGGVHLWEEEILRLLVDIDTSDILPFGSCAVYDPKLCETFCYNTEPSIHIASCVDYLK